MHTRAGAVALVERLRAAGKTIVFTNGVFDLLHPGHLRYLQQSRGLGNTLVVGVNSDRSVARAKGAPRPILPDAGEQQPFVSVPIDLSLQVIPLRIFPFDRRSTGPDGIATK